MYGDMSFTTDQSIEVESSNHHMIKVEISENEMSFKKLKQEFARQLRAYNADDEFTETWSQSFAETNEYTPREYLDELKTSETDFKRIADEIDNSEDYLKTYTDFDISIAKESPIKIEGSKMIIYNGLD